MSQFTPVNTFEEGNERDWPYKLGLLDWDDTRIVFTKRELLNFLKYMGTSVDPNFNNISKLPKYAKFGRLGGNAPQSAGENAPGTNEVGGDGGGSSSTSGFVPTRRVREAPGGNSSISFYDDGRDDALTAAPPPKAVTQEPITEEPTGLPAPSAVPSRRVRDPPGGKDSLHGLWDPPTEEEEFKPTRRVRDPPGGSDRVGF